VDTFGAREKDERGHPIFLSLSKVVSSSFSAKGGFGLHRVLWIGLMVWCVRSDQGPPFLLVGEGFQIISIQKRVARGGRERRNAAAVLMSREKPHRN